MSVPDYTLEDTLDFKFTTRQFSTGAPFAFASGAVEIYEDNDTTQITVGEILTLEFDGVTGLHNLRVDATAANGFENGKSYQCVVSAGTVDSVSVVGEVVAQFSLGRNAAAVSLAAGVNVIQISGDANAADNLELMYDGTGYVDDTAPASRAQVANIGAVSGGSINFSPSEDNSAATIDPLSTAFVGVETNNFTDAAAEDGTYHVIEDSANVIDVVYGFQIGGSRTVTDVTFVGFVNNSSPTDDLTISAFDHVGSAWEVIGMITANSNTDNITDNMALLSKHTGFGSELGKIYIRFNGSSLNNDADLNTDQLLVSAVNIGQSTGYANGQIWVDTINGTAGTENFVNGTADNPVLTWVDALTISGNLGLKSFNIVNGSTVTLTGSSDNFTLEGENWTLELGGQSIANASFSGSTDVSGTSTGNNVRFLRCHIKTATFGNVWASDCRIGETITLISIGGHFFQSCYATTGTLPIIDFGAIGAQTLCLTPLTGGVQINNTAAGDLVHIEGQGEILLDSTCNGGTLEYAGDFRFTDNATSITVNPDDNTTNLATVLADTNELQTDDVPSLIAALNDPTAAATATAVLTTIMTESYAADGAEPTLSQALYLVQQSITEKAIVGTSLTIKELDGSTTAAVLTLDSATAPTSATRTA